MNDDELTQVVDILWWHRAVPTGSSHCACGWRPSVSLNDTESDRRQHVVHQADMLNTVGQPVRGATKGGGR